MTDLIRRVHGQEVPATGVWETRPERASIQFTLRRPWARALRGHMRLGDGVILIAADPHESVAAISLDAGSLSTSKPRRDARRRARWLATDRFPTIDLLVDEVEQQTRWEWTALCRLRLRDMTIPIALCLMYDGVDYKDDARSAPGRYFRAQISASADHGSDCWVVRSPSRSTPRCTRDGCPTSSLSPATFDTRILRLDKTFVARPENLAVTDVGHRNPLHRVAIVGAYNTPQAKRLDGHTSGSVTMMAIRGALEDAGLSYSDVDGLSVSPTDPSRLQKDESLDWAYRARLGSVWAGSAMLAIPALLEAVLAIASGQCSVVVVASGQAGLYTDRSSTAPWTRPANEFVQCWGLYTAAEYALVARRHMHQFGTTAEQLALAAATIRTYGAANPAAVHFGRAVTVETVLSSPLIADPFHLLDCSMTSEGGAGIVLTTIERARDLDGRAAFVLGGAIEGCGPGYTYPPTYDLVGGVGRAAAARAFGMAGIRPTDVDVCELYDPFSFEVIRQFEAFGFCAEGEGGPFVESGIMAPDGQFPTCTDGGTMSHSHTGVSQMLQKIVQATRQVRGDAPNQVRGAEVAMCSSAGSGSMFNPVLLVGSRPAS